MTIALIVFAILLVFGVFGWVLCRGAAIAVARTRWEDFETKRFAGDA